jgi:hypothetical protein
MHIRTFTFTIYRGFLYSSIDKDGDFRHLENKKDKCSRDDQKQTHEVELNLKIA